MDLHLHLQRMGPPVPVEHIIENPMLNRKTIWLNAYIMLAAK
jgi:hypothetical protein